MPQVTGLTVRTQEHHTLAPGARTTADALALCAWPRGSDKQRLLIVRNLLQGTLCLLISDVMFLPEHPGDTLGRA